MIINIFSHAIYSLVKDRPINVRTKNSHILRQVDQEHEKSGLLKEATGDTEQTRRYVIYMPWFQTRTTGDL